ncbi:META domain-containing protein [Microbacterium sp. NPDC086615]|uniref:META domain-containing protein n=1 Tax=Microbacterium sp. NPDC086615 TaxID=3154865 RepID=UPI0034161D6A
MSRRWPRHRVAAAALALVSSVSLLSSCANGGQSSEDKCAELIPNVEACRTYSLEKVPETAPKLGSPSQPVTLRTEGHSLVIDTGCNTVSITGDADGQIFISSEVAAGLKLCSQEETASESWLTEFFSGTTTWTSETGLITVTKGDVELVFEI